MKISDLSVIEDTVGSELADFYNENPYLNDVVDFKDNPNVVPYQKEIKTTVSFNQPIQEKEEKSNGVVSNKKKFITKKIFIDKTNIKCIKVELTPSVCDICAFDVVEKRHGRWGLVPVEERHNALKALEMHKRTHMTGEQLICDEDQLTKSWLGSNTF